MVLKVTFQLNFVKNERVVDCRIKSRGYLDRATELFNRVIEKGTKSIDEFIENAESEELFLDFKESSDRGCNSKLSKEDLSNFGVAVSGFGNSQGGIIIWGVRCKKKEDGSDVAYGKIPIENPKRFRSWLEGCVSGRTLPPHPTVRNYVMEAENNSGYIVSLISKSDHAPHQEIKTLNYYMRAGSSFVKVPHDILSGMFGRRPQPKVIQQNLVKPAFFENNNLKVELGILLRNNGVGIAKDVFLCADIISAPKDLYIHPLNTDEWNSKFLLGVSYTALGKQELRIPPTAKVVAMMMSAVINEKTARDIRIYANCGSDGGPTTYFELKSDRNPYIDAYNNLLHKNRKGESIKDDLYPFAKMFWGLQDVSDGPKITSDICL